MSQTMTNISRAISRQGMTRLKYSQEPTETGIPKASDLLFKSAILCSLLGVSFSMFGISQLQAKPTLPRLRRKPSTSSEP